MAYKNKSASWQQGFNDYMRWFEGEYETDEECDQAMFPNLTTVERRRQYMAGWDHANYSNAYD